MKKAWAFVVVLVLAASGGLLFARWARVFGGPYHDYVHSAWELADRDVVVGGDTQILSGLPVYLWLSRMSPSGAVLWQKKYFLDENNKMVGFEPASDGGFAVLSSGFWFLKLDADGSISWQRRYSSTPNAVGGRAMKAASDGGWILGGGQFLSSVGWEVVLVKINSAGAIQWQKRYGAADYDELIGIDQTEDGGYVLAVRSNDFSAGEMDYMVVRVDSVGALQWAKTYGGADYDEIKAVRAAPDGGYYVVGRTESFGLGGSDVWLLKLSSSGAVLWQKTYGASGSDQGTDVYLTPDGNLLVSGMTSSYGTGVGDVWALSLDASGNILWQKTFGAGTAADWGDSIRPTMDEGVLIGASGQSVGYGQMDNIVLRLFPDGALDAGCPSSGYHIGTSSATARSTYAAGVTASLTTSVPSITAATVAGAQIDQSLNTRFVCEAGKKGRLR
jgi:hypothetical protein